MHLQALIWRVEDFMSIRRFALAIVGVLALASPVAAQPAGPGPQPVVLRGKVTSLSGSQIVVKPAKGQPVTVAFTPDWSVQVTRPIAVDQIKPGSFVGTANMPTGEGQGRSLEVHVFPPGVKVGEGHYGWSLKKGSMMTNGTVGRVTTGPKGRELLISYPNGQRKVVVPPRVPVVEIVGGERAQLKTGIPVFLIAFPKPDGGLITNGVSIGVNGAAPPM